MTSGVQFEPHRSDYVLRFFTRVISKTPLTIMIVYSLVGVGGTLLIAAIAEQFREKPLLSTIMEDYANLISMGIVLPIGILLVFNFYAKLKNGFEQLIRDKILVFPTPEEGDKYLHSVDAALNRNWFFPVSVIFAVSVNATIIFNMSGTWHSWDAGIHAWWFRLVVVINFYMIANILLKSMATVLQMRRVFDGSDGKRIVLQPLHPDGCGGLKQLGAISIALNSFLCLIAVYLSVLAFAKGAHETAQPSDYPLFIPAVLIFVALSLYLFFAPLTKAHTIMDAEKKAILGALNDEFQTSYARIVAHIDTDGIKLEDAQKIESIERLYRIASAMPVWPMDGRILRQLSLSIAFPLSLGIVTETINRFFVG